MLTKQHRYSFRNGAPKKSAHCPLFVLRYEPASAFSCAIVVSKKIHAHAVERNRLKRLFKKALNQILEQYEIPYAMVFYVRKKSNDAQLDYLYQTIEQMFKKEGIIL